MRASGRLHEPTELLELMNPVWAVNHLHYANESLNLQNIPKQKPLKVLESVLRMITVSDRYQGLLP
jgi:hypothetical protein